jgi:hypothetical protein
MTVEFTREKVYGRNERPVRILNMFTASQLVAVTIVPFLAIAMSGSRLLGLLVGIGLAGYFKLTEELLPERFLSRYIAHLWSGPVLFRDAARDIQWRPPITKEPNVPPPFDSWLA